MSIGRVLLLGSLLLAAAGCGQKGARGGAAPSDARSSKAARASELLTSVCVTTGPESCFDATDDNCNGIIDEGCGVETGPVQFAIAWEPAKADVDLRVTDPAGELAEVGRPLSSGLTKQRDCPGRNNECRGKNLENVFLDAPEPLRGKYGVRIVLESLGGESPPVRVRFGARVGPRTYTQEIFLERSEAVHVAEFTL